jgi:hypothetical protein
LYLLPHERLAFKQRASATILGAGQVLASPVWDAMECDHLLLSDLDRNLVREAVANADRVYLAPMDKGLSGSTVWQARWTLPDGRLSKLHVFKIGPTQKLEAEERAIIDIASVIDHGFPLARLYRASSSDRGLLRQEFAGDPSGSTFSLRNFIRHPAYNAQPDVLSELIARLYEGRLKAWHYGSSAALTLTQSIEVAVPWWRSKINLPLVARSIGYQPLDDELRRFHGISLPEMSERVDEIISQKRPMCIGPVHGDLHAQNVNLDDALNVYLIDFGNTTFTWRALDFLILEAAVKFASAPAHAPLSSLLRCEELIDDRAPYTALLQDDFYGVELRRTLAVATRIREQCIRSGAEVSLDNYRAGLVSVCAAFTSIEWIINRRFLFHSIAYHLVRMSR